MPAHPQGHTLYELIYWLLNTVLNDSALGFTMVAVINIFFQAMYINRIAFKYKLFSKQAHFISFIYIALTSLSKEFNYFSVVLVLNWTLIASFDILLGFHQTSHPRKYIFNAGLLLSIAALIHFPAIVYVILLFLALSMLRSFNAGEWVVGIMGYLTGFYFFTAFLFLFDQLPAFMGWPSMGISLQDIGKPLYMTITITGVLVLTICGVVVLQQQIGRIGIFMRRNWVLILSCLGLSTIVALSTPIHMRNEWLAIVPALSLIIAHPFYLEKNKVFSNFVFYFLIVLVILCQVTY